MPELAEAAIPVHVDPALVADFDYFADRRFSEAGRPHDALLRLGEEIGHGIFWTPRNGGHCFTNNHELIFDAARIPELLGSANASFPAVPLDQELFYPPFNVDPPAHAKYRLPLMRAFAPDRMRELERS